MTATLAERFSGCQRHLRFTRHHLTVGIRATAHANAFCNRGLDLIGMSLGHCDTDINAVIRVDEPSNDAPKVGEVVGIVIAETRDATSQAVELIKLAIAIREWDKLLLAINFLMAQQYQFVASWDETVRNKGGERWIDVHVRGHQMSAAEFEARTGVTKQQVSRWRGWLTADQIDGYRQRLREAAFREAGISARTSHRTLGTGDNECDGYDFHERTKAQAQRDKSRDRWLQTHGYMVLRFTGTEIYKNTAGCAGEVFDALRSLRDRAA